MTISSTAISKNWAWSTSRQKGFLEAALVATILTAFPSKYLYYLAPIAFIGISMFMSNARFNLRFWMAIFVLFFYNSFVLFAAIIAGEIVSVSGFLLWFLLYLPLILLWAASGQFSFESNQVFRYKKLLFIFLWIQIFCCALQVAILLVGLGDASQEFGDSIAGTFGLWDVFGGLTIGQVFFTFSMICVGVFLFPLARGLREIAALIAIFALVSLAQAAHQIIFAVVAIAGAVIISKFNFKLVVGGIFLITLALGSTHYFYPQTVSVAQIWFANTLFDDRSPKLRILDSTLSEHLLDVRLFSIGAGAGQGTSRAALFASGELSESFPDSFISRSSYFDRHMLEPLEFFAWIGQGSAISKPFFSLLTIFSEHGVLGVLLFFTAVVIEVRRLRRVKCINPFYCRFFWFFLLLCAFVENYFEFVQALMLPVILYIVARSPVSRSGIGPTGRLPHTGRLEFR